MPKKTITGTFADNSFSLENTWFSGAKLLHNGDVIANDNSLFALSKDKPMMSAKVMIDGSEATVEAFGFALITVKLQIRVNGTKIAGDDF